MHISQQTNLATDAVWLAEEPPLWSTIAASNGSTPVALVFTGPGADTAKVIGIEVPDGQQIRYELQLLGPSASNARTAGNLSRRMSGFDFIPWSAGATFSFVDASAFP